MQVRRATALGFLAAAMACDVDDDPRTADELDEVSLRDTEANGFRLNGFRLNGFRLNGFRLNGFRLNGDAGSGSYIDLEMFQLAQGWTVAQAWLEGSELRVTTTNGMNLVGTQLVGAVLHFGLVEGAPKKRKVKVSGATQQSPGSELWLYNLEIKDDVGAWQPLCVDRQGLPVQAIMVGAVWDPATGSQVTGTSDLVTLACVDAAIGKCAEWGYYPWAVPEYHQACTRMVRADYCGDGVSHTIDGVAIHVLDEIGIEEVDPNAVYTIEAEWGPEGATCLNPESTRLTGASVVCELAACGESFASGGLIQTGVFGL
ncbi:ADYC domain-containing protein [Nannocystis sp. SCPEA4]|uniref:ADYC domain-containing protein n=1 Tax=Nannocystis sp. SCPEA4 TaxID=2996787 RepID=UPI00226E9F7D|nr:ADYC domain-containing protein [Nannocystis sp. SCPEA4]MCY1056627.1 ADYC domain-containing protein [Nannocystis sp. SCPEA4]